MPGRGLRGLGRSRGQPDLRMQPSDADIEGSKVYWEGLGIDDKLGVMRFDEAKLVERVLSVQTQLCRSDMQCFLLGIRGQDAARQNVGMGQFAMECDADGVRPVAFFAKPSFVERMDLTQYIGGELGGSFLKGRPMIRRQDWSLLFEKTASSWTEFMRQVLRLAELAILDAFQHAAATSKRDSNDGLKNDTTMTENVSESRSSKRKTRKKRQLCLASSVVHGGDEHKAESCLATISAGCPADSLLECKAEVCSTMSPDCPEESLSEYKTEACSTMSPDGPEESLFEESSASVSVRTLSAQQRSQSGNITRGDDDAASISTMDTATFVSALVESETILQVDWNAAVPPLETVEETNVELQVDWSENAEQPAETRWSAWATNGLTGVRAEWHWVAKNHPSLTAGAIRAHMKNTFVEVVNCVPGPEELRRAKSAPAPRRRSRLQVR